MLDAIILMSVAFAIVFGTAMAAIWLVDRF